MDAILANVLNSWRLSGICDLGPGATDFELKDAETKLCRKFPLALIDLYRECNGAYVLRGNIMIDPLDGKKLSVVQSSDFLRKAEWPIPDEAVVFGGDGGDDLFALWIPTDRVERPIVIEVGSIFSRDRFQLLARLCHVFSDLVRHTISLLKSVRIARSMRSKSRKDSGNALPINWTMSSMTQSIDGPIRNYPTFPSRRTTLI